VFINAAVLGLNARRGRGTVRFDRRVRRPRDFIEEPVKNYSSGMYVRLGFGSPCTPIRRAAGDEILSVGDEAFAHRGLRRIEREARRRQELLVSATPRAHGDAVRIACGGSIAACPRRSASRGA